MMCGSRCRSSADIRRQVCAERHAFGEIFGQRQFFIVGAAEQPLQHLESHIIELQLRRQVRAIDEQVEMVVVG